MMYMYFLLALMSVLSTRDSAIALYLHLFDYREKVGTVVLISVEQILHIGCCLILLIDVQSCN